MSDPARLVMQRIEALARISEEPQQLTRTFCSPAMHQANELVSSWMHQAGMTVRTDAIGNLIGHYAAGRPAPAPQYSKPESASLSSHATRSDSTSSRAEKVFLLGSHLDTVRNAGKFDGALGVLLALACVEQFHKRNHRLPFGLSVIGFADEEGVRYHSAYLGSRAVAGSFDQRDLLHQDSNGIFMTEAIQKFGGQPLHLEQARLDPSKLLGYLEAHIEQGPILERKQLAVGLVTAIAGQTRLKFVFSGRAAHAGTTPMRSRRDALCAAAEFVTAVEREARRTAGLVATVGQLQTEPNASNVIPGTVILTLDVRHREDAIRRTAGTTLRKIALQIANRRGLKLSSQLIQQTPSVPCSPTLSTHLESAIKRHQKTAFSLPSGAGHDAAVLSKITPVAMLFIRCKSGISHHPDESVKLKDVRIALKVMTDFLTSLAHE
jgi:allantoate deiminase